MMGLFNKKQNDEMNFETDDRLIIYDLEKRTTDIYFVTTVDDEKVIAAGRAVVPKSDCIVTVSEIGRVYTYNAPTEMIVEVEKLAKLEQSIVLQQLTNYTEPIKDNPNLDFTKWALFGLLFVAIIVAAF